MNTIKEQAHSVEPVAVRYETAARMLDCSPVTVWRLVRKGLLKKTKVGADARITVDSIRAYVQQAA